MTCRDDGMRLAEYPDDIAFATAIGILPGPFAPSPDEQPVPPRFMAEARLFRRLGLSKTLIARMLVRANRNGTTLEAELLASGALAEDIYYEALAEILHLPFLKRLDPDEVEDMVGADVQLVEPTAVRIRHPFRQPIVAIIPSAKRLDYLSDRLRSPLLRMKMAVTTPSAMRAALWQAGRDRRLRESVDQLFGAVPEASARITLWGRQGFYTGTMLTLALVFAVLNPTAAILLLHIVLTVFFFATVFIRFIALLAMKRRKKNTRPALPAARRPVYSVFVALYREAAVVPQLIETLNRLEWPATRLDIKLICEADDSETLDALSAMRLGRQYEIVEVPPGHPRTKPKALTYALGAARGDYLVIYDAEDRVDPMQLEEAWRSFEAGPADIACLQAPLIVTNGQESRLSALFAMEYAGLFRVLLPRLAAARMPMPLGGTSNHFRTRILQEVGGWDPYNVTEDADLGLRLYRKGYRCGTISRPTYEEAPTEARAWTGQRTRWFKGWLQTWLVLMRRPVRLVREMGLGPSIVFQVLIGGLILSSLAHPLILAYVGLISWQLFFQGAYHLGRLELTLFVLDIVNIFGSYAAFVALGRAGMTPQERAAIGRRWMWTPVYWLLVSKAAWRAVIELRSNPFSWNKTSHRPARSKVPDEPAAAAG